MPNLKLLASTVAKIRRGSHIFFGCSLGPDPRQFWSKSLFFGKLVPNPSCVPNLKLLATTVAEICRGSQIFLDAPLAQTPANFGPKRCFWQATPGPNPTQPTKVSTRPNPTHHRHLVWHNVIPKTLYNNCYTSQTSSQSMTVIIQLQYSLADSRVFHDVKSITQSSLHPTQPNPPKIKKL